VSADAVVGQMTMVQLQQQKTTNTMTRLGVSTLVPFTQINLQHNKSVTAIKPVFHHHATYAT